MQPPLPISERAQAELDAWGFTPTEREGVIRIALATSIRKLQRRIDLYAMRSACEEAAKGQQACV